LLQGGHGGGGELPFLLVEIKGERVSCASVLRTATGRHAGDHNNERVRKSQQLVVECCSRYA